MSERKRIWPIVAAGLMLLSILYLFGVGPVTWLYLHDYVDREYFLIYLAPFGWVKTTFPSTGDVIDWFYLSWTSIWIDQGY